MLFEQQEYQQECVDNIISILRKLNKVDIDKKDYLNFNTILQEHYKEKKYNFAITDKPRLDVLMETGTGKTFVYLNTIFEMHKQFNKKHFIIVVPSIAIKLGIIQQIELTKAYFSGKYKQHLDYIDYDSKKKSKKYITKFL